MVSIDEITEDINKVLGEADLPTPTTEDGDTRIPKSVCSDGRPEQSFVALYMTHGRLSGSPDGGPDEQAFDMFHWKTLRCHDIISAMSAVIGFELAEMAFGSSDVSDHIDIDGMIENGTVSTRNNRCGNCDGSHDAEITIQRGEDDTRYIHILESNERTRQILATMITDDENTNDLLRSMA